MINVLNCGLNFCILPIKIDITQMLVDWKGFEQSMIWAEFWYDKETTGTGNRVILDDLLQCNILCFTSSEMIINQLKFMGLSKLNNVFFPFSISKYKYFIGKIFIEDKKFFNKIKVIGQNQLAAKFLSFFKKNLSC